VTLTRAQLIRLARLGAEKRLKELDAERKAIEALLGGARRTTGRRARRTKKAATTPAPAKRRGWNAAQRKAAAARMKAYWAKRKAARH
jgi:hypothetical protein